MTISMAQRLSAPTTRMIESIAIHLAETFSGSRDARGLSTDLQIIVGNSGNREYVDLHNIEH